MDTMILNGRWFEVEITQCYTWMILRDRFGSEWRFYNDAEGLAELHARFG